MNIMIKRFDSTKVQYDWVEIDTHTKAFNTGNSGVASPKLIHDLVITVSTQKEFKKQAQQICMIGGKLTE